MGLRQAFQIGSSRRRLPRHGQSAAGEEADSPGAGPNPPPTLDRRSKAHVGGYNAPESHEAAERRRPGRGWIWALRIGCVVLSALILWRLSRMVRPVVVVQTFKSMRVRWFGGSVLLYGALLLPVALRWHLVLKLSKYAISPVVTYRYTVIGHLFYTLLFGWIGGDSTKAVLYARKYRMPLAQVLATVPFDRFMGTCSSLIIAAVLLSIGLPQLDWHISWIVPVIAGVALALLLVFVRPQRFKPFHAFFFSFKQLGRTMLVHPLVMVLGICCGLLCQVSLSAVLALNLISISTEPLPLGRMLWTFPAVVAISALPITIGGLGAREAAAVFLFRLYGVSTADAISASLLSFCASSFWALIGGALLIFSPGKHRYVGGNIQTESMSHSTS